MASEHPSSEDLQRRLEQALARNAELEEAADGLRAARGLLEQQRDHYRLLYEHAPLSCLSLDAQGRILDFNASWLKTLGFAAQEVQGRWFGDFLDPAFHEFFTYSFNEAMTSGSVGSAEFVLRAADGERIRISLDGRVSIDDEGRIERIHCIVRDVTEQDRLKRNLDESRTLLEMAQAVGRTGGWRWDLLVGELSWTDEHFRLLGYAPGEVRPGLELFLDHIHPDDRQTLLRRREAALGQDAEYRCEFRFRTKEGDWRHGLTMGHVQRDDAGTPRLFYGIFQDITRRRAVEEKLRSSEEQYRAIFQTAPIGIFQATAKGRILAVNRVMWSSLGCESLADVLDTYNGKAYKFWADPGEFKRFFEILRRAGKTDGFTMRARRKDGTIAWGSVNATLEEYPAWEGGVINGFFQDITAQKTAEDALDRHRELLTHTQSISKVGGWEYDSDTDRMSWTEETYRIHDLDPGDPGLTPGTLLASTLRRLAPDARSALIAILDRCGEHGEPFDQEFPFTTAAGRRLTVRMTGQRIDVPGKGRRLMGTIMDITALRKAERMYTHLFESMLDGFALHEIILDDQGRPADYRFLAVNPSFERLTGLRAGDVIGRTVRDILPGCEPQWIDIYGRVALTGHPASFASYNEPLGKFFEVAAYQTGEGQFASIFTDVTERVRGERDIHKAKEEAEAANRAKSQFLANMSHEIRTPLNGMLGLLQLLKTTNLGPSQGKYVDIATQSGWRLNQLVDDILDISRVEAGRIALRIAPFDLGQVMESVHDLFRPAARQKGLSLELFVGEGIPRRLRGDSARLQQVLGNLIGNALKFTIQGKITVECYPLPTPIPGKCRLLFSISDTGIGIPDDKIGTLFQAFTQAESSYTRSYQGAGLGLYISRKIVELMDGNMAVASEEGVGTTLHFCVLLDDDAQAEAAPALKPEGTRRNEEGLRVLVVEDDRDGQFFISELLTHEGHSVRTADNGALALDALAEEDFDVVLMDIQMPVMNGLEATRAIRTSERFTDKSGIPILAITAYAMAGDRDKFLSAGMNGYLSKPVGRDSLLAALKRHVKV